MRNQLWGGGLLGLFAGLLLFYLFGTTPPAPSDEETRNSGIEADSHRRQESQANAPRPALPSVVEPDQPALQPYIPPSSPQERSPLADALNSPQASGGEDVAVVFNLMDHYRQQYGAFPTGEDNRAIVNALSGNNPSRLAFLPRDHPSLNAAGELVDRWGSPYFFHLISRQAIEVRSAGPDRKLYTPDDLLKKSPNPDPNTRL